MTIDPPWSSAKKGQRFFLYHHSGLIHITLAYEFNLSKHGME